jgi:cyclophilin family peptidyl-prolyl cis-trans isomerase
VAKRSRRDQQHLRQEGSRRRQYKTGGTAPNEVYKPGFPMNLFGNVRLFALIGAAVAVILVLSAFLTRNLGGTSEADDRPTPTPTATIDPSSTPTASPTPAYPTFPQAEQVIDAATKVYRATLKTSMGDIVILLDADAAPNTVNSFVFLAEKDYFDNTTFHRVVGNFVIQGGDPLAGAGSGPGYSTNDEPSEKRNVRGTISMAKVPGETSFGSQFFINVKDNPGLDFDGPTADKFYPFGAVESGLDVVDAISRVPTDAQGKPLDAVTLLDVVIEIADK